MNKLTNKPTNRPGRKRNRNDLKNPDPLKHCEREPSGVPLEVSLAALADPKRRFSAGLRRRLFRSRARVVNIERASAVSAPIKYAKRLTRLTLRQVIKEVRKSARKASTAKYILAQMSPNSNFRPPLEAEQNAQLHKMRQAAAEQTVRTQR